MSTAAVNKTSRWLAKVDKTESVLCAVAFALLTLCIFSDVLLRELFGNGIHWAQRIALNANVLLVFAGFGLATTKDEHLRPRILDSLLPDKWDPIITRCQQLFLSLFYFAVVITACVVIFKTYQLAEKDDVLGWPVWPLQSLIPLAFMMAAIRHAIYFFRPALIPVRDAEVQE